MFVGVNGGRWFLDCDWFRLDDNSITRDDVEAWITNNQFIFWICVIIILHGVLPLLHECQYHSIEFSNNSNTCTCKCVIVLLIFLGSWKFKWAILITCFSGPSIWNITHFHILLEKNWVMFKLGVEHSWLMGILRFLDRRSSAMDNISVNINPTLKWYDM